MRARRWLVLLLVALLAGLLSACGSQEAPAVPAPSSVDALDPSLRQVYEVLGGEDFLGPVISGVVNEGGLTCQLTMNVALCVNPGASGTDRYVFAPIGERAASEYQWPSFPYLPAEREVNGIMIYSAFEPIFDSLYGVRFTGAPLTPLLINQEANRLEQYFENVVMAANLDSPTQAYLLPMGHYACEGRCFVDGRGEPGGAIPMPAPPMEPDIHPGFVAGLARIQGLEIIGKPLTRPFETADGYVVQIFANVVARAPIGQPGVMELIPLARQLEMAVMDPVHKQYDKPDGMVFYNIGEEALGYHVPIEYDEFIDSHGGRQFSGDPVAEVLRYEDGAIRQCFESYCLDYNTDPSAVQRVSLYPLGARYLRRALEQGLIDQSVILPGFLTLENVNLVLAEEKPEVASDELQVIYIGVFTGEANLPVPNVGVRLKVTLPDGSSQEFGTLQTSAAGQVVVQLSGLPEMRSGSLVVYEACLDQLIGDQAVCESDAYIIWDTGG